MKSILFVLAFMIAACNVRAQSREWSHPYVGYSNTSVMTIDKVEFQKNATVVHAAVDANGDKFGISTEAYLSADGKHYPIRKAKGVKLGRYQKSALGMKQRFSLYFDPVPSDAKLLHFAEFAWDEGWKLCNIRQSKEECQSQMPEEWQDVAYCPDDSLPLSRFSDDSTTVRVTILNYTPEAGRNIELEMCVIDDGRNDMVLHFPISKDGTSEIKLHPCFPLTVLMGIGSAEKSPVIIVPGEDISILMDLGNARDRLAAVGFKGTMADTNYRMNVLGLKDSIQYDCSAGHLDSLLHDTKHGFRNELLMAHVRNKYRNIRPYSKAVEELLGLLNDRGFILCKKAMSSRWYYTLKEYLKPYQLNKDIYVGNMAESVLQDNEEIEGGLCTSNKLTLCPLFGSSEMTGLPFTDYSRFIRWDTSQDTYVCNQYNKDIARLSNVMLFAKRHELDINGDSYLMSVMKTKELKDYCYVAASRWKKKVEQMNQIPHVHFDQYLDKKGDDLRKSILDNYKGKYMVIVRYDMYDGRSVRKLDELKDFINAHGCEKAVFVMVDARCGAHDTDAWLRFVKDRPGEHYGTGGFNLLFGLLQNQDASTQFGIYCEVYTPEGDCVLSTKDAEEMLKVVKDI